MLHLHRSSRADGLLAALAASLRAPLEDPFASEVIAVPTRGIERWIGQQLSLVLGAGAGRADGVCANVRWPSPRRLVEDALAAGSGVDPDEDPWRPELALWPLLEVAEANVHALPVLRRHLEQPGRRLAAVRHLAGLFETYGVQRPERVRGWAAGREDEWQADLWRLLRERIGTPSPAERLPEACERLRAEPALLDLPERLAVFGLTRLPASRLAALEAIAAHRDVHLHLLHPSRVLWAALADHPPVHRRFEDPTAAVPQNRLLASWGQDARELQLVLASAQAADHLHEVAAPPATLLGRLQADVHADDPRQVPVALAADPSLEVHACHGRARQVEVLRDALLHRLSADPTLELRDVIVLCPDIETFAPLIQATFAAAHEDEEEEVHEEDGLPVLRVRLADRSLRQTNPVLGVVARVLELASARVTTSDLLDLADREPVRRRFGLDDDELARIEGWAADAGVRWGLDAAGRAAFGLGAVDHGTWEKGLQRVLLGAAMAEDGARLVGGVLPLDDVPAGDVDLAGRLAELVDRAGHVLRGCAEPRTAAGWADLLGEAADLLCLTAPADAWQRAELDGLLLALRREAGASSVPLSVAEVGDLVADRLRGRPTRANFRSGALTFCTLHPMRAVPHRLVCLLGLDDDVFPRGAPRDGDDLTLADPLVGDRDGRLEDRQLLLDAVLSATDGVLITYSGRDERTNAVRPPAVPVGELLEAIERTAGPEARKRVVREHPLQPFDPRAFAGTEPWGFDRRALAGARALAGPRVSVSSFLPEPLPPVAEPAIDLDDLVRFTASPAKAFLRRRLGVTAGSYEEDALDGLTLELDGLGRYAIGQRLLDARVAGVEHRAAILAEIARGTLPPGQLARGPVLAVAEQVEALRTAAEGLVGPLGPADSLDVRLVLGDGRRLGGTVSGITGEGVRSIAFSRLAPKHRLAAWVRLLALAAARPEGRWRSVTVGRGGQGAAAIVSRVGPLVPEDARRELEQLVDLFDRGQREPLPMACVSSAAYAAATDGDPAAAAAKAWTSTFGWDKEDRDPEHVRVWGEETPFARLLEQVPAAGEDWSPEPTRFGQLSRRLWDGLLAAEVLEER